MKSNKIPISLLTALNLIQIIFITFLLFSKNRNTNSDIMFLSDLNQQKYSDAINYFKGGDIVSGDWNNQYNAFFAISDSLKSGIRDSLEPFKKFAQYYLPKTNSIKKYIEDYNPNSKNMLKYELIKSAVLDGMLKMRLSSYFLLDRYSLIPYSKQDTIDLGEEYHAYILFCGRNTGANYLAIMENGDTLSDCGGIFPCFRENPTSRGHKYRKGKFYYFSNGSYNSSEFEIEYFVK